MYLVVWDSAPRTENLTLALLLNVLLYHKLLLGLVRCRIQVQTFLRSDKDRFKIRTSRLIFLLKNRPDSHYYKKSTLFANQDIQGKKIIIVTMNSVIGTQLDLRIFSNLSDSGKEVVGRC